MATIRPPLIITLALVLVTVVIGFFALREIFLIIQGPSIESQPVVSPVVSASAPIGEKREVSPYSPATAYSPVKLGMQSSGGSPEGQGPLREGPPENLSSLRSIPTGSLRSEAESIIDGSLLRADEGSLWGGDLRALPMGRLRSEAESIIEGSFLDSR